MWTNMTEPQVLNPKKLSEVFGGGGKQKTKMKNNKAHWLENTHRKRWIMSHHILEKNNTWKVI